MSSGIQAALKIVNNNQSELARRCEVTPQAVQKWVENSLIPLKRVLEVEKVTGVCRTILRPDYYPPKDKAA